MTVCIHITPIDESESDEELQHACISSEDEFNPPDHTDHDADKPQIQVENSLVGSLVKMTVMFLRLWQSAFTISDTAMAVLLKFLISLLTVLAENASAAVMTLFSSAIPASVYLLRKHTKIDNAEQFLEYVVCPACYSLYKIKDCLETLEDGEQAPKVCCYRKFPNHRLVYHRKPCGAHLLKKVHLSNGKVEYRPRYIYAYQPLKTSLQRLLNRPGFVAKLEHWRSRKTSEHQMSDIYDGDVWKEFSSDKYGRFLKYRRNYGVMLNFDFFQPYKHVSESYGVLYLTLMNLPRSERFKQENVILVGIIPPFEHEPSTLNPFLRPLIDELKEFWESGVRLNTAESPQYKLLFRVALMCVACDIPAARKCCGFKGHSANYGCSRCMKLFPGEFGKKDFSGFDRSQWPLRTYVEHMRAVNKIKKCTTQSSIDSLETATGVKHSIVTELPYFNPIRFTIIDPMHNLFLGTAKTVMKKIWLQRDIISSAKLNVIQCRIDNMSVPSDLGRIPKKIASNFSGFTAEQLKNWVLLYSMYALRGILSQDEYHCWQAFVLACFLVCRRIIERQDIVKADLLFVKFCHDVERLYGKDVITPNMHLHCHLSECIKDYGSVYGFWCFSYERYNGILGSFPTNKKNIASQLLHRFIYESESRSLSPPKDLPSVLQHILPPVLSCDPSEIHRHLTPTPLTNCVDLSQIYLPTAYKESLLSTDDFLNIKSVYRCLYADTQGYTFTRSIKVIKSIRLYGQQFGSMRDPRTRNSSFVIALWAKNDGTIYSDESSRVVRPGRVLHYILNKVQVGDVYREHLFAVVGWLLDHQCKTLYGKPMEIWDHSRYIEDGPATFLPVHKITCRFVAGYGRVSMPHGREEQVMFVCPIPNFGYF